MQHKSQLDQNTYHPFTLQNGLKTLMVNNPQADKSACALAVRTGSYDDNIQGIAHFLEHMLFMGTEQYPTENDFMDFLSKHNGSTNAYTGNDITVYYFDVDPNFFLEALERFAHFFKTPLFLKDSIDREINAVDSEYKNVLNYESQRIIRLCEVSFNDEYAQFNYGNNETLRINGIREKVIQFWKDNYSGNKMCLTLFHKSNVKFEVIKFFESIESKNIPEKLRINTLSGFKPQVIRSNVLGKIIKMVPRDDIKELRIHVELPIERDLYKNNVYGYIGFLLQNENKNQLTNILKIRGLIFDLDLNFWHTYTFTLLDLHFKLTEEGYTRYNEVIQIFYNFIKNISFNEDDYNKLSKTKRWEFRYLENKQPSDYVTELAENMFFYPHENILNHDFLYEKFDENQARYISDIISEPKNWLMFLICKGIENENIMFYHEEYFNIKYSICDAIEPKHDDMIKNVHPYGSFCYIYENSFLAPKSSVIITLNKMIEPKNYANTIYFMHMVQEDFLTKYDTEMFLSSVTFEFQVTATGMQLSFYGNNKYLVKCIEKYFECFESLNPTYFKMVKQMIKTANLNEKNKPPYKRVIKQFYDLFYKYRPSIEDLIETDEKIIFSDVKIDTNFFVDFFVIGNCNPYDIQSLYEKLLDKYGTITQYVFKKTGLPECFELKTEDNLNNAVCVFIDICNRSDYDKIACLELLVQNSSEIFFDRLRTSEALGYIVNNNILYLHDSVFYTFIVQSEKSSEFLKNRILEFIQEYKTNISEMDAAEFYFLKDSTISHFSEKFKNLNEYVSFNFELYVSGNLNLKYKEDVLRAIDKIEMRHLGFDGNITVGKAMNKTNINK